MKNFSFVCMVCLTLVGCTEPGEEWYVSNDLGVVDTGNEPVDTGNEPEDVTLPEDSSVVADTGPGLDVSPPMDATIDSSAEDSVSVEDTTPPPAPPTWNDDVLPIFQGACDACHSAGATPFMADSAALEQTPLGSFGCSTETTMAECILQLVKEQQMPLGCAGDKCITGESLETVQAWVDAGAPL
jgi:hypothetical protein